MIDGCQSAGIGCIDCKKKLNEGVVEFLRPIRTRYLEWKSRPQEVRAILADGANKARKAARSTLDEVYEAIGFRY